MKKFNNIKKFWLKKSLELLYWKKKPNISFISKNNFFRWFVDGRLNVFENCIVRSGGANFGKNFKKTAIITVSSNEVINKYSYNDIYELVLILSSFLKKFKKKNTKILIHSAATIESAVSMLACANLGLHFCVLFKELELDAINSRIKIFKPSIILSNGDPYVFKKIKYNKELKIFNLKNLLKINYKKKIFINKGYKMDHYKGDRDLFTLFTSGSTGKPKGITHATAGYLLYAKYTCVEQFGINSDSVVLTASDAGWINGHTYSLFGPLSIGATTILMEKPMLLLNKSLLDKILKKKVSVLYLPVTLIRLMREIYKQLYNLLEYFRKTSQIYILKTPLTSIFDNISYQTNNNYLIIENALNNLAKEDIVILGSFHNNNAGCVDKDHIIPNHPNINCLKKSFSNF